MILRSSLLAVVLGVALVACERSPAAPTRDLVVNPAAAAAYVELKRGLAAVHLGLTMESQEQYSLAKTAFIRSALKA